MDEVLVARIGKPHGLRGEVTVQVHTDSPDERFVVGAVFATEPAERGPLRLRTARVHNGIQLLGFEEALDRTAAEALRGTRLFAAADEEEDDGFYEDDLVGLQVVDASGTPLGTVVALHSRPAQDLLEIEREDGGSAYLPFVEEIVPEVDLESGRVIATPPPGLLELG
ncbi:ribosome maturation factor RimM [Calidifontibacter sp. DB0510]|uniref:Ribosome maturation factor RimM n=1 Tax=Metallococcus carri TaxID=1656884 RepID=A0A967E7Q6_9MICO|nr:ribosome maturation factor RimM [Metallococcus carri]NHN54392.1 ribosome maturation factor RimM [Metallococcus carri]NOP36769.1 ribosome maturation factor RimM [Calidifontibacter sp. DB2511S]